MEKTQAIIKVIQEFLEMKRVQGKLDEYEIRGVMGKVYDAYPEAFNPIAPQPQNPEK